MAKIRAPSTRHFAATGRFIYGCSLIEGSLAELLREATGIKKDEIARAVIGVGDLRVGDYITIIKRVTAVTGFDTKNLNRCLQWVTYFNDVRQVIAHKPYMARGAEIRFSNRLTAKSQQTVWRYQCTTDELKKAYALMQEVDIGLTTVQMQMAGMDSDFSRVDIPQASPDAALLQNLGLPARPVDTRHKTAK